MGNIRHSSYVGTVRESVSSREMAPIVCVHARVCVREKFKELVHGIVGLASLKSTGQDHRLRTLGRDDVAAGVGRPSGGRIPSWKTFLA